MCPNDPRTILHAVNLVREIGLGVRNARPLMKHRQPAESMGCAVQVEEPVGCDARVYSDHSPTSSHSRREMDDL